MMRISRMSYVACIAILSFALTQATVANAQTPPVEAKSSSGLLTFSERDRAIRVAVVFAENDDAVVETIVRFIDARGNVLKMLRGNLSDRAAFIVELTRSDVAGRPDVLVRAEVVLNLPGTREASYPILVTLQPISEDGVGRFLVEWHGTGCGCPHGPLIPSGRHASCKPPLPEAQPESPS